ncbi:MAG TPA: PRC-barrel domain-containing protein [Bacteroidales bacterium]|nr:PRC-barrel domain-containing protein [Bacteroidales bacterium]
MAKRKNILLGRILKVSGYKGAVSVKLEKTFTENIPVMESVFLDIEGRPVPFFISESEYSGGDILKLVFDGYESADRVSEFSGCDVYITESTERTDEAENTADLEGFKVMLPGGEFIGTVENIFFNSGQWLLSILSPGGKAILVPFHEDLIVCIEKMDRHLVIDIPEGLTELN